MAQLYSCQCLNDNTKIIFFFCDFFFFFFFFFFLFSVFFSMPEMHADDQLGLVLLCDAIQLTVASCIVIFRKWVDWRTVALASVIAVPSSIGGVLLRQYLPTRIVLYIFSASMLALSLYVALLAVLGVRYRKTVARPMSGAASPFNHNTTLSWESVEDVPSEPESHSPRSALSMPGTPLSQPLLHARGTLSDPSSLATSEHQRRVLSVSDVFLKPRPVPAERGRLEEMHDRRIVARDGTIYRFMIGSPLEAIALILVSGFTTGLLSIGIGEVMTAVLVARCWVPFPVAVATTLVTTLAAVLSLSITWVVIDKNALWPLSELAWAGPGALLGGLAGTFLSKYVTTKYVPAILVLCYMAVATTVLMSALLKGHDEKPEV
jgi:uncharacterized membrane protein YfcA